MVEKRERSMSHAHLDGIETPQATPPASRPRLITPQGLAVVAVTVAASLAVLFPGLDFGHPRYLARPDELSISYLAQVLRQRPDDRSARLLLARQQIALGKSTEAEANLRLLVESREDAITWRARLALVELERAQVDALAPSDPARGPRRVAALRELRRIVGGPLDRDDLPRIAEAALALESPADAATIYERLASQQPARRREWALLAARWYRAAGRLPESATAYLAASAAARPHEDGAADLLAAIDVMRATDEGRRALDVVEDAIARWPADRRLLQRGVDLALAQNDVHRAQSFGARLVALAPADDKALSRQLDLDLAAGDNEAALRTLTALVERRPEDEGLRYRLAQVATWANRPEVALGAWAWLAVHGSPEASEKALALGQALFDHRAVISLLEAKARGRGLKLPELLNLVDALESEGNPEGARAALRRFETLFGNEPEYWKERASIDEHLGDLDGALASLRQVQTRFASFVEVGQEGQEAELLWSMDRPDEALASARLQAQTAAPSAVQFWRLFGDLAWSMEADADANTAYQHVWAAGAGNAEVAERLATLLAANGHTDQLANVAAEAFQKYNASSVLVTGIDAAIEAERWDAARTLASIAAPRRAELQEDPSYLSAVGRLALHDGQPNEAVDALTKAVELSPRDGSLAEDLRAARIDAGLDPDPDAVADAHDRAAAAASERLAAAIERHDRRTVRAILATDSGLLSLSDRVDAERELGRDDRAWDLLVRAPTHTGDADEDASLAVLRHDLVQDRMSGAAVSGRYEDLSGLGMVDQEGRVDVKWRQFSIDAVAEHDRLDSDASPLIGTIHSDEGKAGLGIAFQGPISAAHLGAGAYGFSSGFVPYAVGDARLEPLRDLSLDLQGFYHQRPIDTPALRAAALKDSAELEVAWRLAERYLVAAAGGATHYTDRSGAYLASGAVGRMELSALLRKAAPLIRARADGFVEANRLATTMPVGIAAVVQPGTSVDEVLPETYGTAGVGLTLLGLTDNEEDMGSARGPLSCTRCLRPFADLWAGWLMPAQRLTYSFEGGLGYLFARHQEIAATGFYRSDQGGLIGQRYAGLSLLYALRWL
jgi:tetratricopeptide (TPR) repeat protein